MKYVIKEGDSSTGIPSNQKSKHRKVNNWKHPRKEKEEKDRRMHF